MVTQVLNGYSLGLKIPSSDGDSQFYDFLLEITEEIKNKIKTVEGSLRKTTKKGILTETLEIVKYKDDGSAVAYPKLFTEKYMSIRTPFSRIATQSEINKGLAIKEKPDISVPATVI